MKEKRQIRSRAVSYETREETEEYIISGYFAVFNSPYEIFDGASESIAEGAFDGTLSDDIRCLINHDTRLVLGRTKNNTLTLTQNSHGLWGECRINKNDTEAVNLYERVKRGDVDQCSFGFEILDEETESKENGNIHWTIKRVKLYEVSVCTFPAYEATTVTAREKDVSEIKKRAVQAVREKLITKLTGGKKVC